MYMHMYIYTFMQSQVLVQCSLRQMLENGFFHADPHAGNLLAMPSGKLCYLDFGMVSYVESSQRYVKQIFYFYRFLPCHDYALYFYNLCLF
jgi:predicted unusual protein kinase regulating ubiquinone biosynthesis (AarF/ABC1/UbiB family)